MSSARLKAVPPPFEPRWSADGALRQTVGEAGRVHLDRTLPYIVVQRGVGEGSLARRVAVNSPAYLVWDGPDDAAALSAAEAIFNALVERQGRLLVITLADDADVAAPDDSPTLPPFLARLGSAGANAGRAARTLGRALGGIELDLRRCKVAEGPLDPLLPERFAAMAASTPGVEQVSLTLPPIHRRPDGGVYPGVADAMVTEVGDALLRAACAFLDDGGSRAPRHYRSLGRRAYLAAALKADRKLDSIARSFDFLLSISPINSRKAMAEFLSAGAERPPHFRYRPLTVDPDLAKRDLYAIDLSALEDPLLERLLAAKRREIDAQLTMLATRNTPSFRPASMFLYGAVDAPLLADARAILSSSATDPPRGPTVNAAAIAAAAQDRIDAYRSTGPFDASVTIRADVNGLMVSGGCLMIGADSLMPERRLPALLAHEVGVHLLTWFNGCAQGLGLFRTGLAGYEGVQEGLGVFAEWVTGGLTRTRLRLLAGRVVAVDAMLRGATFVDCWRLLNRDHGFSASGAFGITARVYRSGGLAKDAIYLHGFRAVIDLVAAGASLEPFWLGKIAIGDVPSIEELLQRGLVHPPRFAPHFLDGDEARQRVASLRQAGSIDQLWNGSPL